MWHTSCIAEKPLQDSGWRTFLPAFHKSASGINKVAQHMQATWMPPPHHHGRCIGQQKTDLGRAYSSELQPSPTLKLTPNMNSMNRGLSDIQVIVCRFVSICPHFMYLGAGFNSACNVARHPRWNVENGSIWQKMDM